LTSAKTIVNSIGMQLVLIPAGEFLMGSSKSAEEIAEFFGKKVEFFTDEHPQHAVRISQAFYLGQHQVTKGQFGAFVDATGYRTEAESDGTGGWGYSAALNKLEGRNLSYTWKSWGVPESDDSPVVNVSWYDAIEFCKWLSEKEAATYRLPTEAEWEYACKAGSTTMYFFGDEPEELARYANTADAMAKRQFPEWGTIAASDGWAFTSPVGQYLPNRFGLHDMHGNVWEWCQDWYAADYYARSPSIDPPGPTSGTGRVFRGGSWDHPPGGVRSSFRGWEKPDERFSVLGFRIARDA
jgi:formylglycine-generating enzyme required for sulfatase activity